jgi:hypothetical protein
MTVANRPSGSTACSNGSKSSVVIYANSESLVNYNHARIAGERVSTAHVESTANQPVNWRMCKKQQMRWSPRALRRPRSSKRRHPSAP